MPKWKDGWPAKAREEQYMDAQKRYILLTSDVFEREWGSEWFTIRTAKAHSTVDFSGERFYLESLTGDPERGLLHPGIHRESIAVLNVSRNQLTDIGCLNNKTDGSRHDFQNLQVLNASRNMLTEVRLELANLSMLNLSYNELDKLPSFSFLRELQKLILSHNRIDGTLREFVHNPKLWYLDLSSNRFSWRPSVFKEQLDVLEQCHIHELKLWPNPFAEHFKEYQFLTVTALDSLLSLDGFTIDHDLRAELRIEADNLRLRSKGVDYTIFDIKVEEKKRSGALVDNSGADIVGSSVPRMNELIVTLNRIIDRPNELNRHVNDFEEQVKGVWGAHYRDRQQLTELLASPEERDLGVPAGRLMTADEERQAVNEFIDKMQQVLERYDSVQDVLVMCLVRLLACGSVLLSQRCAKLLAEWIDASATELQSRIHEVSAALFSDLRGRALSGMQSINESPFECYEASHGRKGDNMAAAAGKPDSIAECACIMRALSCFGSPALHSKGDSPFRSVVLRPFLPALCREPHSRRGADLPSDEWAAYRGFDTLPDETIETMELQDSNVLVCQERCARMGHGGFVTEESADQPGVLKVLFKAQLPDTLVGMRYAHPGRALHVRPSKSAVMYRRPPDSSSDQSEAWTAWVSGLDVLAVATADKHNAAYCISAFGIHKAIVRHAEPSTGFTEAWMLVTEEATRAFVLLLRVAKNLTQAAKPEGQEATRYFMEHKLHTNCWNRARRRLMENGAPIPLGRLNESKPDFTTLISSLVAVVCAMTDAGAPEVADAVMGDLKATGLDVFDLLVEVSAYTAVSDPVLLSASLEAIYTFLDSNVTRPLVLARVLSRLHDSAILLPYIKGPRVKDENNLQYQELWRMCMVKYPSEGSAQDRMPELFAGQGDHAAEASHAPAGRQGERSRWRSRVPELGALRHPLMHRVLLGVVRLIKLFSRKAQNDPTGLLRNVALLLDEQGRERLLIGPATGLVMCPDLDVKIQCLQVIEHVLLTSPQQLSAEEMGWLLQYLTSTGIGVSKQEEFLMEVLQLIILLVRDETKTGSTFRQKFAKLAIRESWEMLRVNCKRQTQGSQAEEESKMEVSLKVIELLQVCSRPLSGGLRKFLRRVDFLTCLKEVILEEDHHDRKGVRAALLCTWTGREMREVLLPLACDSIIRPRGRCKYHVMVQLADVLQGKSDHRQEDKFALVPPTDEQDFWPSTSTMETVERDPVEEEDWMNQQEHFISSAGLGGLLSSAERYLTGEASITFYQEAQTVVEGFMNKAREKVRRWWDDRPLSPEKQQQEDDAQPSEAQLTAVEECFMIRLRIINQRVSELYGHPLNVYDEKRGSSLVKLAKDLAKYFEENQTMHQKLHEAEGDVYKELLKMPNEYVVGSRLMSIAAAMQKGLRLEKPRQLYNDLKLLLEQASIAQLQLKNTLIKHPNSEQEAEEWARAPLEKGKDDFLNRKIGPKGLVAFLCDHDAQVIDPGNELEQTIRRKNEFKYFGDVTRVCNVVRLIVEFPDVQRLQKSLKEIVRTSLFSVVRVRNRFARPTNFARRVVLVNVEIPVGESKHICELELVVSADTASRLDAMARQDMFMEMLEKSLRDSCQMQAKAAERVAEYLCNELESRSIRHGDTVAFTYLNKSLEVQKEDVFVESESAGTAQVFVVEREAGKGVVTSGDVISLKSKDTGNYLDMTSKGQLRCRFADAASERSNFRFVVEIHLLEQPSALTGGVDFSSLAWLVSDTASPGPGGGARKGSPSAPVTNLHSHSRIRLKAKGTQRYVTVMPGATYLGLAGEKQRVKGQLPEARFEENQFLSVVREGSLTDHLRLDRSQEAEGPGGTAGRASEESQEQVLLEAHMCAALPTQDSCPREGGVYRRAPPSFKVVARRQAEGDSGSTVPKSSDDVSGLQSERSRMPLVMSAIFRCAYVLIEFPYSTGIRDYALDEVLGSVKGSTSRVLTLVIAVQLACHADSFDEEPDIISAWMPAKLLRLFSAALSHAPALSMPAQYRARDAEGPTSREQARGRRLEDRGEYDQHRLLFLDMLAQYLSRILVDPILARLSVVAHRSLSVQEVVLLREFATVVDKMVYAFFANELRCQKSRATAQNDDPTSGGAAALADMPDGDSVLRPAKTSQQHLSRETRADVFATLVPSTTTRVLVHAMLYGVHQEAVAFTSGFKSSDLTVRLISSLVNRSIGVLAAVMHGRSGSEDTACDYHICEAVSQAMSNGAQLVPRARITQLMEERAVDQVRTAVEGLLEESALDALVARDDGGGAARPALARSAERAPSVRPAERVLVIAYAWAGPVMDDAHHGLPRRLLVITSRLNFLVLSMTPVPKGTPDAATGGPPPTKEELTLLSCRDLRRLQHAVVCSKMRQFLGLWWDETEAQRREVLVFESAWRRRAFQQALRMVERSRPENHSSAREFRRGIPEMQVRKEVIESLQETCKRDMRNTALVNVSFVRSRQGSVTSSWGESWSASSPADVQAEVLLLTIDAVAVIGLSSFLQQYARRDDEQYYAATPRRTWALETDSEEESGPLVPQVPAQLFQVEKCQPLYQSPWQLRHLQGVWFLSDAEPKVKLQFERSEPLTFVSDGERQRWRRHLAGVLANQERRQADDGRGGQGWSVVPTGYTEIGEVKQYALSHMQGGHFAHLRDQTRALGDATKAAG